jgi:integrase/recombinase XerD
MNIEQLKQHSADYLLRFNGTTKTTYKQAINSFFEYIDRKSINSTDDITVSFAESFKQDLELDYSPKTCSMYITTIKDFFNYLKVVSGNDNINLQFTVIRPTKVASREQKTAVLTEAEVHKMLEAAINHPDKFQATQLTLMVTLMVNLGLRLAEMCNLKVSDFKDQAGKIILTVNGQSTDDDGNRISVAKNMRYRYISLSPQVASLTLESIRKLNLTGDDLIIQGQDVCGNSTKNKPLNPSSMLRRVKKLCALANIDKDLSPHSLRRTCATILYKRGAPVQSIQRLLGHENIQTTQRYIDMEADIDVSAEIALNLTGG